MVPKTGCITVKNRLFLLFCTHNRWLVEIIPSVDCYAVDWSVTIVVSCSCTSSNYILSSLLCDQVIRDNVMHERNFINKIFQQRQKISLLSFIWQLFIPLLKCLLKAKTAGRRRMMIIHDQQHCRHLRVCTVPLWIHWSMSFDAFLNIHRLSTTAVWYCFVWADCFPYRLYCRKVSIVSPIIVRSNSLHTRSESFWICVHIQ